ncbi:hypothetical protein [Sansalvadorimonas verongulae]|uniref:hypothetical protein n=1 Tax=Sansalvadorimonas verongulae TaxID=2172824 RepID=UPI0012BBB131|nr:hypothetical protein [Sansalvadorimonas verongulae]MTI12361.1 hypothetical protein [Sansalvadorimonas verongulae]
MTMKETAVCCRCGVEKPISELNGYDPITKDGTHAYCYKIAECNSAEAEEIIGGLIDDIYGDDQEEQPAVTAEKLETGHCIETRTFGELVQIIKMLSRDYVFCFHCVKKGGWWTATVSSRVIQQQPLTAAA